MSKKEILKYLLEINTNMSVREILFCLTAAFFLGLIIFFIYKVTYPGTVYSNDFNLSLILMTVITASIMMVIGSNLALSLGLVGSLSIVRFRSAVKENRDLVFVFWAIAAGLACGAEVFSVGLISTVMTALIVLCMSGRKTNGISYLLVIGGGQEIEGPEIETLLKSVTKRYKLRMQVSGETEEITYEIMLKKGAHPDALLKSIRSKKGIQSANLVSYNGEMIG